MTEAHNGKRKRASEWTSPRAYIVPRTLRFEVPRGWELAGPAISGVVGPYLPAFVVTAACWRPEVQQCMAGVALVGAVRLHLWQALTEGYRGTLLGPWGM